MQVFRDWHNVITFERHCFCYVISEISCIPGYHKSDAGSHKRMDHEIQFLIYAFTSTRELTLGTTFRVKWNTQTQLWLLFCVISEPPTPMSKCWLWVVLLCASMIISFDWPSFIYSSTFLYTQTWRWENRLPSALNHFGWRFEKFRFQWVPKPNPVLSDYLCISILKWLST